MKSKKDMYRLFLLIVLIGILCLFFIYLYVGWNINNDGSNSDCISLDDEWMISIDGNTYDNVDLRKFRFNILSKGAHLELERTLPDNKIVSPILYLYNNYSVVTISIDGENVYSYGNNSNLKGKFLGYGPLYVPIKEDFSGRTIKFTYDVTENDAFGEIEVPKIYNSKYLYRYITKKDLVQVIINMFIMIFGLSIFISLFFMRIKWKQRRQILYLSLFTIGIAIYSLCRLDYICFVLLDIKTKSCIEFISLYIFPTFVLLYFIELKNNNQKKLYSMFYYVILFGQILLCMLVFGLQILEVAHFPTLLKLEHFIFVMMVIYIYFMHIREVINKRYDNVIILMGITGMGVFISRDLICFYLMKYTEVFSSKHFTSLSCIGVLILSMSLIIDFCSRLTDGVYDKVQKKALEYYAYTDDLTEIANRRKCEEVFDQIENSEGSYAILNIDLNGFKQINDNYGHDYGDKILKVFSKILKETYSDFGLVGRMGGDEFIVIFRKLEHINIYELLRIMNLKIQDNNPDYHNLLNISYGLCNNKEVVSSQVREVYQIADERMYEMKIRKKQEEK